MTEFEANLKGEGIKNAKEDVKTFVKEVKENPILKDNHIGVVDLRMYKLLKVSLFILVLITIVGGCFFFHYVSEGKFSSSINQEVTPIFNQTNNYAVTSNTNNQYAFNPYTNLTLVVNNYINTNGTH